MSSERIIYSQNGLYVGRAPSFKSHWMNYTGGDAEGNNLYHNYVKTTTGNSYDRGESFVDSEYEYYQPYSPIGAITYNSGVKTISQNSHLTTFNVIKKVDRVQDVSYAVNVPRENVSNIGKEGTLNRPIVQSPDITLSFSYLTVGVRNDHRIGLQVNYPEYHGYYSGVPHYSGNDVHLVSGFFDPYLDSRAIRARGEGWNESSFSGSSYNGSGASHGPILVDPDASRDSRIARNCIDLGSPIYPFSYTDKRNFFINVAPEGTDERTNLKYNATTGDPIIGNSGTCNHPQTGEFDVYGFGDCYLTSYGFNARIGSFPRSNVSYTCDNMVYYDNTNDQKNIPAIEPVDGSRKSGIFTIPNSYEIEGPAALKHGDMTISLTMPSLTLDFETSYLQSYDFSFNIPRQSLKPVGYKFPINKKAQYPVIVNGSFSFVISDHQTGDLSNLFIDDNSTNFYIKIKQPECDPFLRDILRDTYFQEGSNSSDSIIDSIVYEVRDARINSVDFTKDIGNNDIANVTFTTELDPHDFNKGLFISGEMYTQDLYEYWEFEHSGGASNGDGELLFTEDDQPIIAYQRPF